MLERLLARGGQLAEARVEARLPILLEEVKAELPEGVTVEPMEAGLAIAGSGLRRRHALEPRVRWLVTRLAWGATR